ncbi:MFS transporter [Nocardia sp. NPDC059229]|uniref:MFS transporter n=1 Tax=Nocardia sp. NPDC059229 TaxID=3346778 RepID=UPI0036CB3FE0
MAPATSTDASPPPSQVPSAAGRPIADRSLRRLFLSAPFAHVCPQLCFGSVGYFAALQVQSMDPAHKVQQLALVNAVVATVSVLTQPVVGVLSDRTRTRFGARTPWMLAGALLGFLGLITAGLSTSVATLLMTASIAYLGFNTFGGPLTAIQPDRVPVDHRGRYSTLAGLGTVIAAILGPVIGAIFATRIPLGYTVIATITLVFSLGFLIANPDADNRNSSRPPLSVTTVLQMFWINPRRHPDFFWVFLGRFLICGGYYMVLTYQLYIAQDYVGLTLTEATQLTPILSLVSLPGFLLALGIAGPLSDRIGRRKPIVLAGGIIIAASALLPIWAPTVGGLIGSTVVLTIGFGTFLAVDQALVTQVLPDADSAAKDLGIINIASTLPSTFAPMAAAAIVTASHGYGTLYPVVAFVAGLGALAILPVKTR